VTGAQLVSGDIEQLLPELLRGVHVVALVSATELKGWAAEMAWRVARAAAAGGRRTALVDCFVDSPTLHGVAGASNDEGIQDVFEYGASLNRIVQQQPQANLFFVPAGTFAADAEPLVHHPRWRRLSAGFRHEEALLLLYVAPEHVPTLAAEPDGMIVLAPQGLDLAVADAPGVAQAVARGLPLLAVVAEHARPVTERAAERVLPGAVPDEPAPEAVAPIEELVEPVAAAADVVSQPSVRRSGSQPLALLMQEPARRSRWWIGVLALALVAVAAALWVLRERLGGPAPTVPAAATGPAAAGPVPDSTAPARPAAQAQPGLPPVDTLSVAIQVGTWSTLQAALANADSLERHGARTIVAPIRPSGAPATFRVFVGPFARATQATLALGGLRAAGLVPVGAGRVVSVPLSLELAAGLTRDAAENARADLRRAGVPAFVLGSPDGTFAVYAGAYDAATQAALLQDLLTPTGSAGTLVPRVGYVP
jgi:hypothetical protein